MNNAAPKPAIWGGLTPFGWAVAFSVVALVYRLLFCTHFDLVGDEAYYWLLSHRLDWSYFDKGPGVAWTIALSRTFFGDTVFGIRFFAVVLSVATGWFIFLLARRLYDDRIALGALVVTSIVPLFAVGSILMTIDPLSVFFWATAALAFWSAQESDQIGLWLLTGALVGLGALSKYVNLVQIVCFIIFLVIDPPRRRQIWSGRFFAMILTTAFFCLPMVIWNAQHDWVAVRHLMERGSLDKGLHFSPVEPLVFLGLQSLVVSPILFVGILAAVFTRGNETGPRLVATQYLRTLFLPLFLMYALLSLNKAGQPNWTAPAYVAGIILLSARFLPRLSAAPSLRRFAIAGVVVAAAMTFMMHGFTRWLHLPPRRDPLDRARGSADLAAKVDAAKSQTGASYIIANTYSTASLMKFYMKGHPPAYQPDTSPRIDNQFSIWPGYFSEPRDASALLVTDRDYVPAPVKRDFENVERLADVDAIGEGRNVGTYHLYFLSGRREAAAP